MALRVAVGVFAAIRAVLIYGEADRLASQRLEAPSRPAAWGRRARANLPVTPASAGRLREA